MDIVRERIKQERFGYAESDPVAAFLLAERIAERGRQVNAEPLTYSELVAGVTFTLSNVNGGRPFQIGTDDWRSIDRLIVSDLLGHISKHTYLRAGFFAGAFVVHKEDGRPGRPARSFFEWAKRLGAISDLSDDAQSAFWLNELRKGHVKYKELAPDVLVPPPTSQADLGKLLDASLVKDGLMRRMPAPVPDAAAVENWTPVPIKGEPISETIMRERR